MPQSGLILVSASVHLLRTVRRDRFVKLCTVS